MANEPGAEVYERIQAMRPRGLTGLTSRQRQIMRGVAAGSTHGEIAYALGISRNTVKRHMEAIYIRLGARNGPHAVALLDEGSPGWRRLSNDRG